MKFDQIKFFPDKQFRRVTGVKRETFDRMVEIVREAHIKKKAKGGRPNKLTIENMVLMTLEYLREYRTYLHISVSYGLSESNTFTCIKWIENTLVKSKEFKLPGRKALLKSDSELETVLIDATETPIERPKKNSENFTRGKRKDIH